VRFPIEVFIGDLIAVTREPTDQNQGEKITPAVSVPQSIGQPDAGHFAPTPMPLGKKLKDYVENNIAVVATGIFVSGFTLALAIISYFIPNLQSDIQKHVTLFVHGAPEKQSLIALSKPITITVLGPLSGENARSGLRHSRGVLGGVLHALADGSSVTVGEWKRFFKIQLVDTSLLGLGSDERREKLRKIFDDAQDTSDVVFGPVLSQDAVDVLMDRNTRLKVPTILTVARTPRIRTHPQYGTMLFQLSPNSDEYAQQYMTYVGNFLEPKPKRCFILFRSDEYGRQSNESLTKYALQNNMTVESKSYSVIAGQSLQKYTENITEELKTQLNTINALGSDAFVVIADFGDTLKAVVPVVKSGALSARLGTLGSLTREELTSGTYEGMYLIYSFAPTIYSNSTLGFLRYTRNADVWLPNLLPNSATSPKSWEDIGTEDIDTIDAEVHDATIYYLVRYVFPRYKEFRSDTNSRMYATDFEIRGEGPQLGNVGDLFLFKVETNKIIPVPAPN
jgi:ABC-type branched-subunit amino acid transport system substrate-binding protein